MGKDKGELASFHTIHFTSQHVFDKVQNKEWTIEEVIYISDSCTEDHLKCDHPANKNKSEVFGTVRFDLKPLKETIRAANERAGLSLNNATIAVEMTVIDRFIEFKAYWPVDGERNLLEGSEQNFSIASVFEPGTE